MHCFSSPSHTHLQHQGRVLWLVQRHSVNWGTTDQTSSLPIGKRQVYLSHSCTPQTLKDSECDVDKEQEVRKRCAVVLLSPGSQNQENGGGCICGEMLRSWLKRHRTGESQVSTETSAGCASRETQSLEGNSFCCINCPVDWALRLEHKKYTTTHSWAQNLRGFCWSNWSTD